MPVINKRERERDRGKEVGEGMWFSICLCRKQGQQDSTAPDGEEKYIYSGSPTTGLLKTTELMDPPGTRLPQSYPRVRKASVMNGLCRAKQELKVLMDAKPF